MKDRGRTAETTGEPTEAGPRFPQDHEYAQRLASGDESAWEYFSNEYRKKITYFIASKYLNILGDVAIEEICDGVETRLIKNSYKAIREYRGECAFSTYVTRATDWEIIDWLRKNSDRVPTGPLDPSTEDTSSPAPEPPDEGAVDIPEAIKALSDDLRWAFLLRYYDDFDFPLDEIRRIAKKQGVSIREITERIVRYLEPQGEDILAKQRDKQRAFYMRLQKICAHIQESYVEEKRLLDSSATDDPKQIEKIIEIRSGRTQLESKRERIQKKKGQISITTPYKIIAIILGEGNESTIRSRILTAKNQIADQCTEF